jgi:hypothetical protein
MVFVRHDERENQRSPMKKESSFFSLRIRPFAVMDHVVV